ncbi:MAG: xanthine dehydrogenase family protein subunit M [Chloroflexota bacterium]
MWQEYLYPVTVAEAVQMLADYGGRARVIAGGTDLVLQLRSGERQAFCLVDISRIDELRGITEADEIITIGAATTHAEVAASPLIRRRAEVLAQAAAEVGSPQIRNRGTLGGNVLNAQPAADTALALLALDAQAEIVGQGGAYWLPMSEMYAGPGVSRVDSSTELVRAFRFRGLGWQAGSSYRRLGKCKSIALPVICAAAVVHLDGAKFVSAAISLGPVAPRPWRPAAAEAWLAGQPAADENIAQAAKLAQQDAKPRSSLLRCSSAYRREMVAVLVRDTLSSAVAAARR